jgi:2-oxoglutarate dehydrogenase E2 component (dihydrolipoamide succinyltransferase)
MAVEIKVPSVGESITEGILARWLKKDSDLIRVDEPLFELETEKATTEIAAPAAGKLVITVPEGQTVAIGAVVGRIEERTSMEPAPARDGKNPEPEQKKPAPALAGKSAESPPALAAGPEPALSPSARRLAHEAGIDPRRLSGSGRGGRITKEDVQAFLEKSGPAKPQPGPGPPTPPEKAVSAAQAPSPAPELPTKAQASAAQETRERMSPIRQRIAERLVAAQKTAAILTTFNEADMSAVLDLRHRFKERFREKYGVGLGFMSFFVKACVEALRAFPRVNARIDGAEIVYPGACHIGVAVSTDKGLMVPVIRDAGRLSFADIEKTLAALAAKARDGKISVDDLQGGTFTITNGGVFGSLLSTPILNPPQSGILGMHAIQKRPVALNDQVVIRPMMYLALSYDHRIVDGREAVQFLVRVKECVEVPERMLLEI